MDGLIPQPSHRAQNTGHRAESRWLPSLSLHRCLPPPSSPPRQSQSAPCPSRLCPGLSWPPSRHAKPTSLPAPVEWASPSLALARPIFILGHTPQMDANGKIGPSTGAPSTANGATHLGATNNGRCRVRLDDSTLLRIRCPGLRFAHALVLASAISCDQPHLVHLHPLTLTLALTLIHYQVVVYFYGSSLAIQRPIVLWLLALFN